MKAYGFYSAFGELGSGWFEWSTVEWAVVLHTIESMSCVTCAAAVAHDIDSDISSYGLLFGAFIFCWLQGEATTLLAGHTHQPDESDCGGLQHCCH
jgi:hypothetical protein